MSPWSADAPNADDASDMAKDDASDRTTEAIAAAAVIGAGAAVGGDTADTDETSPQTPEAEQRRNAPVLAYIWLVVLTLGIGYLIYGHMTRGETFEATAAKADAAAQAIVGLKPTVDGHTAAIGANSAAIAGLDDIAALAETSKAHAKQLATLEARLAEALEAISASAATAAGSVGSGVAPAKLLSDVAGLQADQAATATKLTALTAAIAALDNRLAPMEERAAKSSGRSLAAAILALNDLRDAVSTGKPFAKILNRARAALPEDQTLKSAPWTAFAGQGLPTDAALLADMQALSIAIGQDKLKDRLNSGESWLDKAVGGVVGRLKVRRVGAGVEGEGPAAVAARAEAALADDNLNGAIKEVEALEGEDAERFASWLNGAKAVAAASADIDAIEAAAIVAADGT